MTSQTRTCLRCPATINKRTKSGLRAACASADPAVRAKKGKLTPEQRAHRAEICRRLSADRDIVARRAATGAITHAQPMVKEKHRAACAAARARYLADPAARAKLQEAGRTVGASNFHWANTPESRAKAAEKIRRAHLAWCPEQYWPLNETLKRSGARLAERKQMIADQVAADEARRVAALTPFERQMERLTAGGTLTTKFTPRKVDPDFTLGGVGSGML